MLRTSVKNKPLRIIIINTIVSGIKALCLNKVIIEKAETHIKRYVILY